MPQFSPTIPPRASGPFCDRRGRFQLSTAIFFPVQGETLRQFAAAIPINHAMMPDSNPPPATEDDIRARAKRYYEEAGSPEGRDDEFWLRAERDLREQHTQPATSDQRPQAPASKQKSAASAKKD